VVEVVDCLTPFLDLECLVVQVVVVVIILVQDQTQVELEVGQQEQVHLNQLKDILAVVKLHHILLQVDMKLLAVVVPVVLVSPFRGETLVLVDMVV
tara:strand:+ start:243 stop:530 length:288 start_codon:yes stop_codon:yes gene_type:complete